MFNRICASCLFLIWWGFLFCIDTDAKRERWQQTCISTRYPVTITANVDRQRTRGGFGFGFGFGYNNDDDGRSRPHASLLIFQCHLVWCNISRICGL